MFKRVNGRTDPLGPGTWPFVFGVVALGMGVFQVVVGMSDYTDHTERADAVVSERHVEVDYDNGQSSEDVTVFVDYDAEGEAFTRVELEGLNPDDHYEGEELPVAYAPGEPDHVVTVQSTEEGAFDVFFYIGIAALVLSVPLLAVGARLTVRHFRRNPGALGPHKG